MGRAMGRTLKETYDITVGAIVFCESGLWGWFLLGQSSVGAEGVSSVSNRSPAPPFSCILFPAMWSDF